MNFNLQSPERRQLVLSASFIGAAILASASIFATGPSAEPEVRQERAWPVSVLEIEPRRLQPSFSAYGRLESTRSERR